MGVDLEGASKPRARKPPGDAEDSRAPLAPPELVRRTDGILQQAMASSNEADATFAAGAMFMVMSWLRWRHVERAMPTKITDLLLHIYVSKDKCADRSGTRRGYRSIVPRFTPSESTWAC